MSILYEYKNTICYKHMDLEHQKSFDRLVNVYGEALNNKNELSCVLFTPHNFNNHCNDIFNIIDKIIIKTPNALNHYEYYILCLSVLFHDISMSTKIGWDRRKHSVESAEYFMEQYNNSSSALNREREKVTLRINDANTICAIITAHSDVKDGSVDDENNGIFNSNLNENMPHEVNGKLLAAILRLADELDITSDRLNSEKFSEQLNELDDKQKESKHHWKKLHYFSEIKIDADNSSNLCIYCDDEYINQNTDDLVNIVEDIKTIKNKIEKELRTLNLEVFLKSQNKQINFNIQSISIITKNQLLLKYLKDEKGYLETYRIDNFEADLEEGDFTQIANASIKKDNTPNVLNAKLQNRLDNQIENHNLFKGGHFIISEDYCANDWIDCNEIIETKKIYESCIEEFVDNTLKITNSKNHLILGLDFFGSIIAAQLASCVNMPFQYVIPAKSTRDHVLEDIKNNIPPNIDIILVTDVIATYSTVMSVVESLDISNRIKAIYTLLYRKPNRQIVKCPYLNITYCISNSFPVSLIDRKSCIYNKNGKCIALNKVIR